MSYDGLYRAKTVKVNTDPTEVLIQVPQVFGNLVLSAYDFIGDAPAPGDMGYVGFVSGEAEWPVWVGDAQQSLESLTATFESVSGALEDRVTGVEGDYLSKSLGGTVTDAVAFSDDVFFTGPGVVVDGTTMHIGPTTGVPISMYGQSYMYDLRAPVLDTEAVRKSYVDQRYNYGLEADLPTDINVKGMVYYATDTGRKWRNTGVRWLIDHGISADFIERTPDTSFTEVSSFSNSWANTGSTWSTAGYMKDPEGWVHLKGTITGGTTGQTAFTLPTGYKPRWTHYFVVATTNYHSYIAVLQDGTVIPYYNGGSSSVSIDGISFYAPEAGEERSLSSRDVHYFPHDVPDRRTGENELTPPRIWRRQNNMAVLPGCITLPWDSASQKIGLPPEVIPFNAPRYPFIYGAAVNNHVQAIIRNEGHLLLNGTPTGSWLMWNGEWPLPNTEDLWTDITYETGWIEWTDAAGTEPSKFYKDDYGFVHIQAFSNNDGGALASTQFVMPSGYRPSQDKIFPTINSAGWNRTKVLTNGEVKVHSGTAGSWHAMYFNYYAGISPELDFLRAGYAFEEASGTILDTTTSNYDSTYVDAGITYQQTGPTGHGYAISGDGTDDCCVEFPHLAPPDSFTLMCWVRPDAALSGWNWAAGVSHPTENSMSFNLYAHSAYTDVPAFWWYDSSTVYRYCEGVSALAAGEWTHLAGVFDKDDEEVRLYVNGVYAGMADTSTTNSTTRYDATGKMSVLGPDRALGWTGDEMAGRVDDVRIYDYALTQEQISTFMDSDTP